MNRSSGIEPWRLEGTWTTPKSKKDSLLVIDRTFERINSGEIMVVIHLHSFSKISSAKESFATKYRFCLQNLSEIRNWMRWVWQALSLAVSYSL